jgi:hypothetical protein
MARTASDMADLMAYDDLCARIYADKRMPPGTRELALTLAWATLRDPERHGDTSNVARARRILGWEARRWRLDALFYDDVPRYEHPREFGGLCDGPRHRPYVRRGYGYTDEEAEHRTAGGTRCGESTREKEYEYDMTTGQVTRTWWFCSRHKDDRQRVRRQLAERGDPPPAIPNRGGLIACYFTPSSVEKHYRRLRPRWKPPYYGICADDWPALDGVEVELIPRRPRLALITGGLAPELHGE